MSALKELLERVEKAEGPDRELDGAIADALGLAPDNLTRVSATYYEYTPDPDKGWWEAGRYTASIDAAVALVEKKLPGCALAIGTMKFIQPGVPWATIWTTGGDPKWNADAKTPALALIAALLKALIASELQSSQPSTEQSK